MKRLLRGAAGLAVGFGGTVGVILFVEEMQLRNEPELIGSPDFQGYCARDNDDLIAMLVANDAFGWHCAGTTADTWGQTKLDPGDVCRWEFGPGSNAILTDPASPQGWSCTPG